MLRIKALKFLSSVFTCEINYSIRCTGRQQNIPLPYASKSRGNKTWIFSIVNKIFGGTSFSFKNTHAKISTIKTSFSFLKSVTFLVIEIKVFQCDSKLIIALISTTGNQLRD